MRLKKWKVHEKRARFYLFIENKVNVCVCDLFSGNVMLPLTVSENWIV